MTVHPGNLRQVLISAVIGALVVLAPELAGLADNGFSRDDIDALNPLAGAAVAAALRAAALYLP